ncbi:hypothetical protein CDIK_0235 [Cucumispora dikerogammari]|nr:hypothetical protein CDIK_0235 [Cucumispora dikerogammari]
MFVQIINASYSTNNGKDYYSEDIYSPKLIIQELANRKIITKNEEMCSAVSHAQINRDLILEVDFTVDKIKMCDIQKIEFSLHRITYPHESHDFCCHNSAGDKEFTTYNRADLKNNFKMGVWDNELVNKEANILPEFKYKAYIRSIKNINTTPEQEILDEVQKFRSVFGIEGDRIGKSVFWFDIVFETKDKATNEERIYRVKVKKFRFVCGKNEYDLGLKYLPNIECDI